MMMAQQMHGSHRRIASRWSAAVILALVLALIDPAAPAANADAPTFASTLAGPSLAEMYPSGLEYDPAMDRLVIADTGLDRVLLYSRTGTKLGQFGTSGTGNGQFLSPRDVAVDGDSNIYVADAENNRVQKFDSAGNFQWALGGVGACPTCLNTPIGITWDSQNSVLLVASTGQSLIKAYNAAGAWQWTSPSGTLLGIANPRDVMRGPDGRIWVTGYRQHQMKAYDVTAAGVWNTTPAIVLGDGLAGGSGAGQLNFPYNIVFSADGDTVYVSDTGNGRVARWDLSGPEPQWLAPFGQKCPAHPNYCPDPPASQGQFNHLRRVAIDGDGNVYAADFWGNGIEVFAPDGSVVRQIAGVTAPAPGFAEPYGVAAAPDGSVYVMERLNHRIQRFDPAGAYLNHRGSRGVTAGTFSWPESVAVGPDGTVWALDTRGDRFERFSANLSGAVSQFGGSGSAVGQFNFPSGIAAAPDGTVWIADTRNHRVQRFDPVTSTFSAWGMFGAAAGQLAFPEGVAVTDTAVYVADTGNNRIQKFGHDGSLQAEFSGGLSGPEGVALGADGTVWVADTNNHRILHLSADLVNLGDTFGSLGTGEGQFDRPHSLAVHGQRLLVADTYNHRVQVFTIDEDEPPPAEFSPAFARHLSDPGGVAPLYPAGGVTDVDGVRFIADSGGSRVVRISPDGVQTTVSDTGWNDPRDIALDPDGEHLWVMNTSASTVVKITKSGSVVATFGGLGGGAGQLRTPFGFDIDDAGLYIADTYNQRVVKLDPATGAQLWASTTCNGTAFLRPRDLGIGPDGNIYVADTDNHRVVSLTPDGACIGAFGSQGMNNGQFRSPRAITSDGAAGLWVADAFNYRLQHVTTSGAFIAKTGVASGTTNANYGTGNGQFRQPACVWMDGDVVAACDTWNYRIQRFNVNGAGAPSFANLLGGTQPAAGGFNRPFAAAYGPGGVLYTADWFNHRLQRFTATEAVEWERGGYGTLPGALIFPRDVKVASNGNVVVTNSEGNRIDLFSSAGAHVESIRPTGTNFQRPHQTALAPDGTYWVADTLNNRVLHLDGAGTVLHSWNDGGQLGNPRGIAIEPDGNLLVTGGFNAVRRYSPTGQRLAVLNTTVRNAHGLALARFGEQDLLFVADTNNNRVLVLGLDGAVVTTIGTAGSGDGQLAGPRGIAADPARGLLAIADQDNNRLSIWTTEGGGGEPVPDTTPPSSAIQVPTHLQVFAPGPVPFSGTAEDNVGVAALRVAVQDIDSGLWWQANGTWGPYVVHSAALASPGAPSTTWSFDWPAPPRSGNYGVLAVAQDTSGNIAPVKPWRRFAVETSEADTTPPDGVVSAPTLNQALTGSTVQMQGTATDNVGVTAAMVAIRDRDSGLWWTGGGWGAFTWFNAALASPGATSTTWSYTWTAPGPGNYGLSLRTDDAAGNTDPSRPWVPFSVREESADTQPPNGEVTTPTPHQAFPAGAITLQGTATDNIGVTAAMVGIRDRDTGLWWTGSGWGAFTWFDATLASPGATSTTWSYTWTPPNPGNWGLSLRTDDAAGNTDPTRPWVPFSSG